MLKVQAYVDDELNPREAREMAARLERDPEARALCTELQSVRSLMAGNELEAKLPESREFFWSKVEREIIRSSAEGAKVSQSKYPWWVRILGPAVGFAMLLAVSLPLLRPSILSSRLSAIHEIETPLEETSSISFHSESAGMTVVWVQTGGY
jgi:anti-sigma factor RsiW